MACGQPASAEYKIDLQLQQECSNVLEKYSSSDQVTSGCLSRCLSVGYNQGLCGDEPGYPDFRCITGSLEKALKGGGDGDIDDVEDV